MSGGDGTSGGDGEKAIVNSKILLAVIAAVANPATAGASSLATVVGSRLHD